MFLKSNLNLDLNLDLDLNLSFHTFRSEFAGVS
jgi:hypothetical protein